MVKTEYNVQEINASQLSGFTSLTQSEVDLIPTAQISKKFNTEKDFIEISFFTLDGIKILTAPNHTNFSILSGDGSTQEGVSEIFLEPLQDYKLYNFLNTEVQVLYNFLTHPFSQTTNPQEFFIEEISPDRTEVRVGSLNLSNDSVESTVNSLRDRFNQDIYSIDLNLSFGDNIFVSCVNIDTLLTGNNLSVVLKLTQPLPNTITANTRVSIIEKVAESKAYEIGIKTNQETQPTPTLRRANFDIEIENQSTEPSQYFNLDELFSFPTNNTNRELNSLFNEKGAELGIDYSSFSNFVNFSSVAERLYNFKYKLGLIEQYQTDLDAIEATTTYTGPGKAGSREFFQNKINGIINNFDHYERFLFYEKDDDAWPKTNNSKPYINELSTSPAGTTWFDDKIVEATDFDTNNTDLLLNTVPSFLREDPINLPYETFIHMIAQHFDNIWIYTDNVSKKYDNDNRLNRGISKDLVEEALKNFGVKLYTSNRSAQDLFKYFTVNSYDLEDEIITGSITQEGTPVSQNDYQKEIYKRIYHNLPLLMKSKGTERGLRALINCFGIPSDVLKIKLYGGQSSLDLPFFGGEQEFTGSIDKIRLDNTGSNAEGGTLSYFTSINTLDRKYTQDLHKIEVGFSPSDNINQYIVSQSQVDNPDPAFNIDQYIGDPRLTTTNRYLDLKSYTIDLLSDVERYDVRDFVRLIKFFDNVIFRMVKDFIPARAVADTGIIIKPHLLDRSKVEAPIISWTQPEYTGSIDTAFVTGSQGGTYAGGYSTNYEKTVKTPQGEQVKQLQLPIGLPFKEKSNEEAKFDGELKNSYIRVTNGELNEANPYKQPNYPDTKYDVQLLSDIPTDVCIIESPEGEFILTEQTSSIDLPDLFTGVSTAYSYEVGDISVVGTTYIFTGSQYTSFIVTASHSNTGLTNLVTGQTPCTSSRVLRVVECELGTLSLQAPDEVSPGFDYDLTSWFDSTLNTQLSLFVNDQPVSTPSSAQINLPIGTPSVMIRAEDLYDEDCKREISIIYNGCPLADTYTLGDIGGLPKSVSDNFLEPYGFQGTNSTTAYSFKLQAIHQGVTYLTPDWVTIISDDTVPDNYTDIVTDFPTAIPEDVNGNTYAGTGGVESIQFRATNGSQCESIGILRNLLSVVTYEYQQRDVRYSGVVGALCAIAGEEPNIWFYLPVGDTTDTLVLILRGDNIYSDATGTTLAGAGYYTRDGDLPGDREYRYWTGNSWGATYQCDQGGTGPGGLEEEPDDSLDPGI